MSNAAVARPDTRGFGGPDAQTTMRLQPAAADCSHRLRRAATSRPGNTIVLRHQTVHDVGGTVGALGTNPPFVRWTQAEVDALRRHPDAAFDIVYLWVNGSEETYVANQSKFRGTKPPATSDRDRDNGELRFSLRSLDMYMPWWNGTLYFVHQNLPCWLDLSHPRLKLVHHRDIFLWQNETLPSFNSDAIEMFLHRIPGLSKVFALFNDDFFLGKLATPADFVVAGKPVLWFEPAVVAGDMKSYQQAKHDDGSFAVKLVHTKAVLEQEAPTSKRTVGGTTTRHKFHFYKHAPFMLDRDRLAQLWQVYGVDLQRSVRHRFRSIHCLDMVFLHHHHCLLHTPEDCAVVDATRAAKDAQLYLVGSLNNGLSPAIDSLLLQPPLFICMNDAQHGEFTNPDDVSREVSFMYRRVLPKLYPYASQLETSACRGPIVDRQYTGMRWQILYT